MTLKLWCSRVLGAASLTLTFASMAYADPAIATRFGAAQGIDTKGAHTDEPNSSPPGDCGLDSERRFSYALTDDRDIVVRAGRALMLQITALAGAAAERSAA